jgi:hypothetical protein
VQTATDSGLPLDAFPDTLNALTAELGLPGFLAIAYSRGLDIFTEKDPFCFDTRAPLAC